MTDAPERIWAEPGLPGYVDEPWDVYTVQYIRADLHNDLVKAADELAECVKLSMPEIDDHCVYYNSNLQAALTAYRKAKEKMNG